MTERFRRNWRGAVISSEGFSVRLNGQTTLLYSDSHGAITVSTEPMASDRLMVTVFSGSIPDSEGRSRAVVMDNIGRAFRHAGWTMIPA